MKRILTAVMASFFLACIAGTSSGVASQGAPAKPDDDKPLASSGPDYLEMLYSYLAPEFIKTHGLDKLRVPEKRADLEHALAEHFRKRATPRYFPSFDVPRPQPTANFKNAWADGALDNQFVVRYGQPMRKLTAPLNWLDPSLDFEEKNVLHRHHWADALSTAYWQTGEEKYLRGCIDLIRSWREAIPPPPFDANYNVMGWRGLECAARVASWLDAWYRFKDSPAFTDADIVFLAAMLAEHGARQAPLNRSGNHGTATNRGLFFVAAIMPELREAKTWRDLAAARCVKQLQEDVGDDGFHIEHAPGYHIGVMKDFGIVQRLARLNDVALPDIFERRIESMYECLMNLSRPNITGPLLNDHHGDTYFVPWMAYGSLLYNRPDFKFVSSKNLLIPAKEMRGLTSEETMRFQALKAEEPKTLSVALETSGHYVMRSGWKPEDRYLLVELGKYAGWHSHADQMNVDLYAYGRSMIVDPGCCHYMDPALAHFKSSLGHNVLLVDGAGANVRDVAKLNLWLSADAIDLFDAELSLPKGPKWRRVAAFIKPDYWIIWDSVTGAELKGKTADQLWHYVPGQAKVDTEGRRVLIEYPATPKADGNLLLQWPKSKTLKILPREGWLSGGVVGTAKPDQSGKAAVDFLSIEQTADNERVDYETLCFPYRGSAPAMAIDAAHGEAGSAIRVSRGDKEQGTDREETLIVGRFSGQLEGGEKIEFDGDAALIVRDNGKLRRVFLSGGKRLRLGKRIIENPKGFTNETREFKE